MHYDKMCKQFEDIEYAYDFSIITDKVSWKGYYRDCEYDGYFPSEYLCMSDEELNAIIEEKKNKYIETCNKKLQEDKARKEKAEYEQYIKLKEKSRI